jgi:class 3 adenylate cyclase
MGEVMQERFWVIAPFAYLYLAFNILLWFRCMREACSRAVSYVLVSLDLAYVVVVLFGVSLVAEPGTFIGTTSAPPFFILFLLNALSGLRFDFKISLYCAVISVLIVFGLGAYDAYHGFFPFAPGVFLETFLKAVLVGATALVSGYIGQRSRRLIAQAVQEQEEKRFIKSVFGRHASEEVVEDALKRGLELGGEEREVTVLFADIRNFTSLAERLQPSEVVDLLNDYFARMVDVITGNGGMLNKFMGDGILAIFGAPMSYDDSARRAVVTALRMTERLTEFNRRQVARGKPELVIGIGIGTGNVIVGNIGSIERMEYTAVGDPVNLASRLDELNKQLGTSILVSPSTYQQVVDGGLQDVGFRRLGPVEVKGREQGTWVYQVLVDQVAQSVLTPSAAEA